MRNLPWAGEFEYFDHTRFVNTKEDVEVFPEVPAIMKQFKDAGYRVVGITNQGSVALGHLRLFDMQAALMETQAQCNSLFDKNMVCIHHPEAQEKEMAICWCRKPRIGMIVDAAITLAGMYDEYYPPHLALFVGDRPEDKGCAEAAGICFVDAKEWPTNPVVKID